MSDVLFVYAGPPIDWWIGWNKGIPEPSGRIVLGTRYQWNNCWERAQSAARLGGGWEGDVAVGPYWLPVPRFEDYHEQPVIFGWKQDNNGTSFIVSPVALPWLAEHLVIVHSG